MDQKIIKYQLSCPSTFKSKLLAYAKRFTCFCFLDSNSGNPDSEFDFLFACNKKQELLDSEEPFLDLKNIIDSSNDWLFGYLTYDLKNSIENLNSNNLDNQSFPRLHFFSAEIILKIKDHDLIIFYDSKYLRDDIDNLFSEINHISFISQDFEKMQIKSRITKNEYIETIHAIKEHLQIGDIYEMNYCQEFYVEHVDIDPVVLFSKLNHMSKAPFSSFYRINNNFCLCASPERFLKKEGNRIISQPIKGTIKRLSDNLLDRNQKKKLLSSSKDFSENVMIVDLVRNDFSRFAKKKSVHVDELAALYTYTDVHHLISTISCELDSQKHLVDAIKLSFPMGSMTGAPKIKSMQLIEKYETTLRGLYSGAIGYIKPNKDFDFNVVIRSVFYNQQSRYLSFMVGGAITIDSDPELEYEECLAKAKSIFKVLEK
ncbi:MAG: aminodeoxychorismate synthase component I [Flavobacteriales bacterium]|nr:aminodeoxychorismate synthase component I [Flavobacteriales bacterium]|tara:strand:- start:2635 stop:3921 length:1287 start_codon:yes stop_codon:yes gene_type:complete